MTDLVKREWAYVQNPKEYSVTCDLCDGTNIQWSEYEDLIWCYDCEKDTPGTAGVFAGPVLVNTSRLLGMCFDLRNIETGEIRTLEDDLSEHEETPGGHSMSTEVNQLNIISLNALSSSPRGDLRDHPALQDDKPSPIGQETSLQQYNGTNVVQWHVRKHVEWLPYGDMYIIKSTEHEEES